MNRQQDQARAAQQAASLEQPRPLDRDRPGDASGSGAGRVGGSGALARALGRWRRAVATEHEGAGGAARVAELARRLDDSGCSYGRVNAARIEGLTRGYERLEAKLNAILMAVTGTFLSTLAGLLLYYVRGGSH